MPANRDGARKGPGTTEHAAGYAHRRKCPGTFVGRFIRPPFLGRAPFAARERNPQDPQALFHGPPVSELAGPSGHRPRDRVGAGPPDRGPRTGQRLVDLLPLSSTVVRNFLARRDGPRAEVGAARISQRLAHSPRVTSSSAASGAEASVRCPWLPSRCPGSSITPPRRRASRPSFSPGRPRASGSPCSQLGPSSMSSSRALPPRRLPTERLCELAANARGAPLWGSESSADRTSSGTPSASAMRGEGRAHVCVFDSWKSAGHPQSSHHPEPSPTLSNPGGWRRAYAGVVPAAAT